MICLWLAIAALPGCDRGESRSARPGDRFPLAALAQAAVIDGPAIDFRDKTLLINFWATWCAPCREEMPALQALSDALDRERYAVIGVSVDRDDRLLREFLLEHGIRFANLVDAELRLAADLLHLGAYPVTFVVSPGGVIRHRIDGARPWNLDYVGKLLEADKRAATGYRGRARG